MATESLLKVNELGQYVWKDSKVRDFSVLNRLLADGYSLGVSTAEVAEANYLVIESKNGVKVISRGLTHKPQQLAWKPEVKTYVIDKADYERLAMNNEISKMNK